MASRSIVPLAVSLCTAISVAALPQAPGQPARSDQPRPPTFRTEANFVRVDVFATANGVPIGDLKSEDFEVLEDGVPQKVSTFEYVQVRTGSPQVERNEPNTMQQSRDAMKNPRARVFVLFLDVPHVTIGGAWHSREPLVRMVDRLMGPDDLVGIMTPKMAPTDIVFARKTDVVTGGLRDRWPWGERHTLQQDETDYLYDACFPYPELRAVVAEMKARRRERMTLESLQELVAWLRDQREERKAILTISEGWLLYQRNPSLAEPRKLVSGETEPIPGPEPVGVGPDGRLRIGNPNNYGFASGTMSDCWTARQWLSQIDDDRFFKDIIESANRANASFYTIDPRGLPVFDYPLGPQVPPSPVIDAAHLTRRTDALRVIANNTDGFAVLNNNDLDPGLRRISDDLTSYYLLGYYSTNTKLDGRFRSLKVKIKRPGVDVRARRGYKAATAEEVAEARAAVAAPVPEATSAARGAMSGLARIRPEAKLYTNAIAVRDAATTVWVAAELAKAPTAAAPATVTISAEGATASADVSVPAGQRAFSLSVPLKTSIAGAIDVRVRVAPPGEIPMTDGVRITAVQGLPMPLMFRRGPSTGNRYEAAGQPQFSRTERVRFDVPQVADASLTGVRVLDRQGNPIEVPVILGGRVHAPAETWDWLSAEITLAPLGAGDYVIELVGKVSGAEQKVLSAIRVTR